MSWAKVKKINSNMSKSLDALITEVKNALTTSIQSVNKHLQDLKFQPVRIITTNSTFTPEKTGTYKVICVGAGGGGNYYHSGKTVASGGGGGVAIKTLSLSKSSTYNITVGTTASFSYGSGSITATGGGWGDASDRDGWDGGTASGGDYNYTGGSGGYEYNETGICPTPGSVGVYLSELSQSKTTMLTVLGTTYIVPYGDSILGYGGAGSGVFNYVSSSSYSGLATNGMPAAVIIVPVELEG